MKDWERNSKSASSRVVVLREMLTCRVILDVVIAYVHSRNNEKKNNFAIDI